MAEIYTGCRARFSLNGVKIGFATNVSVRENVQYEPVDVLDNIQTEEHVPVGYSVSMTAATVRIVGDTFKSRGEFPAQGTNAQEFLQNILNTGEMVASLEDSITNQIVAHIEGVKISERNMQITPRGVVGEDVTMVAKRMRNESDLD